jgi:hypothetical protein
MPIHVSAIKSGWLVVDAQERPLRDFMRWIANDNDARPLRAAVEKVEESEGRPLRAHAFGYATGAAASRAHGRFWPAVLDMGLIRVFLLKHPPVWLRRAQPRGDYVRRSTVRDWRGTSLADSGADSVGGHASPRRAE